MQNIIQFYLDHTMNEYHVSTFWDEEAKVWVAISDDVPGLVTEAETVELLLGKLRVMIPELLWITKSSPAIQPTRF